MKNTKDLVIIVDGKEVVITQLSLSDIEITNHETENFSEHDMESIDIKLEMKGEAASGLTLCDVEDCNSPAEAGDLCEEHYDAYFQALDDASRS